MAPRVFSWGAEGLRVEVGQAAVARGVSVQVGTKLDVAGDRPDRAVCAPALSCAQGLAARCA